MRIVLYSLILPTFLLFIPQLTSAHDTGQSVEETRGDYLIDIGIDKEVVQQNDFVNLDFSLLNNTNGNINDFDYILVNITNESDKVFTSNISKPQYGNAYLGMNFQNAGVYTIDAQFEKDFSVVTDITFDVTVVDGNNIEAHTEKEVSDQSIFQTFISFLKNLL